MKKKLIITLAVSVSMIFVLTACSVKREDETVQSDTAKDIVETIVETAVPTPSEEASEKLNTVPWGEDDFTKFLPACEVGAVTQITSGNNSCLVLVEQVEESEAISYMDKLAENGFNRSGSESDLYTAGVNYSNASGITVNVVYTSGMMTLMIQK